ncbi:MAG TPA: hypothetical protein VGW35_20730 [Methylomirabilota bacterium]|nr:hypothetical protein [Methylomirabilota bacterium]
MGVEHRKGEWTYLTYDLDKNCAECGGPLRAGQAVGYVRGEVVHAKCHQKRAA